MATRSDPEQPVPLSNAGVARQRDIAIEGFWNLRDVGGYTTGSGEQTRWHTLLRSDFPLHPAAAALARVAQLPVGTVIDLRGTDEEAERPSPFTALGLHVERRPIFSGSAASIVARRPTLTQLYRDVLENAGSALASVVTAIAAAPASGAVLVHCTAGKDRTGIAIALVLETLGVSREQVVADYADTARHLEGQWLQDRVRELEAYHGVDLSGALDLLAASPPDVIADTLDYLERRWGGAAPYLAEHGVTEDVRARLQRRLVAGDEAAS